MTAARWIVAAMILFFSWRGAVQKIEWPPSTGRAARSTEPPSKDELKWAAGVQKIVQKMTPLDRLYCANFYDGLADVLVRDGERDDPIVSDTTKFESFHAESLKAAIDRKNVGKYDGLGVAIDETFIAAAGAGVQDVTPAVRGKLVAACNALRWVFTIHGE